MSSFRSLSELEGVRLEGQTSEKIRQVTERATLFRITSNAMINVRQPGKIFRGKSSSLHHSLVVVCFAHRNHSVKRILNDFLTILTPRPAGTSWRWLRLTVSAGRKPCRPRESRESDWRRHWSSSPNNTTIWKEPSEERLYCLRPRATLP